MHPVGRYGFVAHIDLEGDVNGIRTHRARSEAHGRQGDIGCRYGEETVAAALAFEGHALVLSPRVAVDELVLDVGPFGDGDHNAPDAVALVGERSGAGCPPLEATCDGNPDRVHGLERHIDLKGHVGLRNRSEVEEPGNAQGHPKR